MYGCAPSWHTQLTNKQGVEGCIHNAMVDFVNTCKLAKLGRVFSVTEFPEPKDFVINEGIVCLLIYHERHPMFAYPEEVAGAKARSLDVLSYIELNDMLFLLENDRANRDSILTQQYLDVLTRYNHIDYSWIEESVFPPLIFDDGVEMIYYFFCSDNPRRYKKSKVFSFFSKERKRLEKNPPCPKCD